MINAIDNQFSQPNAEQCVIREVLQDVFGASFEVVSCADRNDRSSHTDSFEILHQNQWRVVLRGVDQQGRLDAQGTVTADSRETLDRQVRCARKMLEQQSTLNEYEVQLDCFMKQVTTDLEEISWLRSLAEAVGSSPTDQTLRQVCNRVLPRLRELLRAQAVLFIRDEKDRVSKVRYRRPVAYAGDADRAHDFQDMAIDLIDGFAAHSTNGPVIRNAQFDTDGEVGQIPLPESVSSMVLVRSSTATQHCGWIIAIDRMDCNEYGYEIGFSETEFGTYEATLMETAAVILATHSANQELLRQQEQTLVGVVRAMVNSLDARDRYTCGHSDRVARIARQIARTMKMSENECKAIHLTGLLHDIGKIGVSDSVLLKNGPLDEDERRQIEQHTVIGYAILEPVEQLHHVLPGVLHHHERFDGKGYPHRLQGKDIPLSGRILAVADAYDAMTTSRPYRVAMPIVRAEKILREGSGTHWDTEVIEAFFETREQIREICQQSESRKGVVETESLLHYSRLEDASFPGMSAMEGRIGD